MKKIVLAIIFACFAFGLAAQEVYKVKYQGERPTIADFADALFPEVEEVGEVVEEVYDEDEMEAILGGEA